jgi:hypothetical protein
MTKLKSSRQAPHGVFISPTKSGYFNYGPTFTEVFSPSGGKIFPCPLAQSAVIYF